MSGRGISQCDSGSIPNGYQFQRYGMIDKYSLYMYIYYYMSIPISQNLNVNYSVLVYTNTCMGVYSTLLVLSFS